jgi:hypothetical protein
LKALDRLEDKNWLTKDVSRDDGMDSAEKRALRDNHAERSISHARSETVASHVGDRSPNRAIAAMEQGKNGESTDRRLPNLQIEHGNTSSNEDAWQKFISQTQEKVQRGGSEIMQGLENGVKSLQAGADTAGNIIRNYADGIGTGVQEGAVSVRHAFDGPRDREKIDPKETSENIARVSKDSGKPALSDQSDIYRGWVGMTAQDREPLVDQVKPLFAGQTWEQFGSQSLEPARVVTREEMLKGDATDRKLAGADNGTYNCFAYALEKSGVHEPWMDSAAVPRNTIQINNDLLARHCEKSDPNQAQKGDIVLVRNETGACLHAGVVEGRDSKGNLTIRQKPSSGEEQVNEQDFKSFSKSWTGHNYDPNRIEIWHPNKK